MKRSLTDEIKKECKAFNNVESGGRLVGSYYVENNNTHINIEHIIDAGINAKRTPVSLFQDQKYQRTVYQSLRKTDQSLFYFGSWHHHLCNGCPTMSNGDNSFYRRTVDHQNHSIPFFIGLIVVPSNENWGKLKFFLYEKGVRNHKELSLSEIFLYDEKPLQNIRSQVTIRKRDASFFEKYFPKVNSFLRTSKVIWKGFFSCKHRTIPVDISMHPQKSHWIIKSSNEFEVLTKTLNACMFQSASDLCKRFYDIININYYPRKGQKRKRGFQRKFSQRRKRGCRNDN